MTFYCSGSRMLPVFIIMIPFGIMSAYYGLVKLANHCSCW